MLEGILGLLMMIGMTVGSVLVIVAALVIYGKVICFVFDMLAKLGIL